MPVTIWTASICGKYAAEKAFYSTIYCRVPGIFWSGQILSGRKVDGAFEVYNTWRCGDMVDTGYYVCKKQMQSI